jgi:hypothetical protein
LRGFIRYFSRFAFLLLAADCSGGRWAPRRIDVVPFPIEPSAVALIWSGDKVEKWHAVVITTDSVSGIPVRMGLQCDSCRRSMPRAQVDSMKLSPYHGGKGPNILEVAGVVVGLLVVELVLSGSR